MTSVVLITGGTGFTAGDRAPEALLPLFDREVEGFGEVFRMPRLKRLVPLRFSPVLSRGGEQDADLRHAGVDQSLPHRVENIIAPQLDARTRPCNFHPHLKK